MAQARVDEILSAREKAESRELDDIGLVTFNSAPRRLARRLSVRNRARSVDDGQ